MPSISLIIHTASSDDFLRGQGIAGYFEAVTRCLSHQTHGSFELVYVDTFYEQNRDRFASIERPFRIKHVPIHPEHRYYFDRGFCFISAAKNTGIIHADGELLISCDDAEFFPPHLLATYWKHYQDGHLMHALHRRMKTIETKDGMPMIPVVGEVYTNDHRWSRVNNGPYVHEHRSIAFAGTSFSLEDALKLNGYNERMDGCKSLEDCDFNTRLVMSGRKLVMDPDGYLYILDHPSYGDTMPRADGQDGQENDHGRISTGRKIDNLIAVENYGVLRASELTGSYVANRDPLTEQQWQIIQAETIKYRKFDPLGEGNRDNLKVWNGVPTFDLRKQKQEM